MQGASYLPQDVDPPSSSPTSHSSESPIKRRPGSKASAGRAQSKKLRKSLVPTSRQPLGSIPEHEQPPATLADLASRNAQNPVLGRPTLATLESTAFLALGFGAGNGQDFRTRRDPLGRFTLFLISQLVSGSRVSLTQGRAGPAGVETAGREHGSCNHAVGE